MTTRRFGWILSVLVVTTWLLWGGAARAQTGGRFTLSGTVRAAGGGGLPGASVAVPALGTGTAADSVGHFVLTLPAGKHRLEIASIGYVTQTRELALSRNQRLSFDLMENANELGEVVVEGSQSLEQKLKTTQMGVERITIREAKLLPALFGEVDILKTLQLKPGVQSGGEGTSGLFVRGGSADQNLVLLDGAVVYNPNHLFGLFSVFNSDAVSSVDLYKSAFPAQYGGRLSSVVDVKLREGDRQKFGVTGGIGLISSRLTLEGPIGKAGKGSWIVSGRRTYFDVFTRRINERNKDNPDSTPIPDYYFYDFNAKANYTLGPKDQLFISGYLGRDVFGFSSPAGFNFNFNWGNTVGAVRWNHVFSPRLFVNTTASVSDYKYNITNRLDQFSFNLGSTIRDFGGRTDFEFTPDDRHALKFGGQFTQHRFGVGRLEAASSDGRINFGNNVSYTGQEGGIYLNDSYKASDKLQLEGGLRLSGFASGGQAYAGLEPRASGRYTLSERVTLKASYALMYQYVHLVTNSGASLPTDIWYPSRLDVKPQRSQQTSVGGSFLLGGGKYLITNEVYYKWGQNQVDFRDGAQLFVNPNLNEEFLFGRSWSYGNEIYLEKKTGKTTGWIGYTLAWAWRNFPPQNGSNGVNGGRDFHPNYDRRHNLTAVVIHQLNARISLTGSFIFTSGNLTTLPAGRLGVQDVVGSRTGLDPRPIPVYPDRNSFRLIDYTRLDLGMVYKIGSRRNQDLTFSVYNALDRRNAYFIFFETVRNRDTDRITGFRARQVSLFPVIPSVTYNFKF